MVELRQYIDLRGRNSFDEWLRRLDDTTQARVAVALERLESGNLAPKSVGAGVMELRLQFGPGYRVYLGRDGERLVILLGGGTKQRQEVDITAAQRLWREYKHRKREE